ncbi:MAG: lysophospholipid acyltransferase family protein [Bacteroidales bacterium]|nr:lysophospholipid acyltransferase family protein [Bacteroidales bacterium]
MQWIGAQLAILLIYSFKLIPFKILHFKADGIALLLGKVIAYRKKIVTENLQDCFPENSQEENNRIITKFYRNVSDILLESLKGLTINQLAMKRRFKVLNPEILDAYFESGQSVMCLAGHYANWEWGIQAVNGQIKHRAISIYKPLSNKVLEKFMHSKRSQSGMLLFPIDETKAAFAHMMKEPSAIILAADQSPSNVEKSILVNFFNRPLGFLHGPEAYLSKVKIPVVYFDVQRIKRGFYTMEILPIYDGKTELRKNELTQRYASLLEAIIRKKPEDWLWSHKRWKHDYSKHPEYPSSK